MQLAINSEKGNGFTTGCLRPRLEIPFRWGNQLTSMSHDGPWHSGIKNCIGHDGSMQSSRCISSSTKWGRDRLYSGPRKWQKWEIITLPARGIMGISSPEGVLMLPKGHRPLGQDPRAASKLPKTYRGHKKLSFMKKIPKLKNFRNLQKGPKMTIFGPGRTNRAENGHFWPCLGPFLALFTNRAKNGPEQGRKWKFLALQGRNWQYLKPFLYSRADLLSNERAE